MADLLVAEDLLDARVGDARSVRYGAVGRTFGYGCANSVAPLLFSTGAARGCPSDTGEAGNHLAAGGCDGFTESLDCLGATRIVKRNGDVQGAGLVTETVVRAGFLDEFAVGHMARIVATDGIVKRPIVKALA